MLLIDEAHDLQAYAEREIGESYRKGGMYLVVACDRHQKLRHSTANAKIIEGSDFTNKSIRPGRVYRNPAPVYMASLALMFRWFAQDGPKKIPSTSELKAQFDFDAENIDGTTTAVSITSDAHPANLWRHTVGMFPDSPLAFAALSQEKLGHREVLWVRFSQEDTDFDYEQINQRARFLAG